MWPLLLLLACASTELPERFLVIDGEAGVYEVVDREIPELTDARAVTGELGDGRRGGYFDFDLFSDDLAVSYRGGGDIELLYQIDGGVGQPLDEDGLVLWTYYHTLSAARVELGAISEDIEVVFPVDFAYHPIFTAMDLQGGENAAYIGGGAHMFMLLPDMVGGVIPLAANPGVIRHELGHAFFRALSGEDPRGPVPSDALDDLVSINSVSALNEGFADMIAALTLQDPDFIRASIPNMADRDLTAAWAASPALYPTDEALDDFNPYALGTVYASLAWDARDRAVEAGADPVALPLAAVIDATRQWQAEEAFADPDRWAEIFLSRMVEELPDQAGGLCEDYALRFPDNAPPEPCP